MNIQLPKVFEDEIRRCYGIEPEEFKKHLEGLKVGETVHIKAPQIAKTDVDMYILGLDPKKDTEG